MTQVSGNTPGAQTIHFKKCQSCGNIVQIAADEAITELIMKVKKVAETIGYDSTASEIYEDLAILCESYGVQVAEPDY